MTQQCSILPDELYLSVPIKYILGKNKKSVKHHGGYINNNDYLYLLVTVTFALMSFLTQLTGSSGNCGDKNLFLSNQVQRNHGVKDKICLQRHRSNYIYTQYI